MRVIFRRDTSARDKDPEVVALFPDDPDGSCLSRYGGGHGTYLPSLIDRYTEPVPADDPEVVELIEYMKEQYGYDDLEIEEWEPLALDK